MSDADDQVGGTGGDRGPVPGSSGEMHPKEKKKEEDQADDESAQSFPASDPPANY